MTQLYNSKSYLDDLDTIIQTVPIIYELRNRSILITGATGLIGSALVDIFLRLNETHDTKILLFIAGRDKKKVLTRFSRYCNTPYFYFVPYDATQKNMFPFHADYIIHGASNATPAAFTAHPVDTILANTLAVYELLSYAKETNAKSLLYISSSEIYGKKDSIEPFLETDYNYVDILNPRSAYPSAKRAAETLCVCFSKEYNLHVTIVRPGHIYGPTARQEDNRVSSAWALAAVDGQDIIIRGDGAQIRSYCYMLDAATAIITTLLQGHDSEAYNISNPQSVITIYQMAQYIAHYANVQVLFQPSHDIILNPMLNSSLNADKLLALGWLPVFDADTGFAHTITILREAR